MVFKIK